jgi:glutaredoxin
MQVLYTSGTVFHAFLGERLSDWHSAAVLVRKIAENYKLPYFTLSPTYSVCPEHGYINGEVWKCPKCGRETEVYSRITGYYRPVKNWNDGKAQEFKDRKTYNIDKMEMKVNEDNMQTVEINHDNIQPKRNNEQRYILFTTKTCPNCKVTKSVLDKNGILYDVIDAEENEDLCKKYDIMQAPTLVVIDGKGGYEKYCNASNIIKFFNL